jgi:Pro-kumamolisin, activation domain/Bacterial Ig-like domain (group 3)
MKKTSTLIIRNSLLVLAILFVFSTMQARAQSASDSSAAVQQSAPVPARVTQRIDETKLVQLKGNVHPLARPEFDQGAVSDSTPLNRMLLLFKRSVEQESALIGLMVDQHNSKSANYHKWLTPEQFGAQFGPADADVQAVTTWLQSHGFKVAKASKGKVAIEFSGTAAQVRQAFHTEIHRFLVNGQTHLANASDPQIPMALATVIQGLAPLNNFRAKQAHRVVGEFTKSTGSSVATPVHPEFTTSGGQYVIGPTDFATIYNVLPLWNATPTAVDGTGQSIAVIGVSNINLQDVQDFRTVFGLPTGGATNTPIVVIDGSDPGIITDGSETEALLDVEWSGAVAKGAQIHLVIAADTDIASGFLLAIFNVIENNSDPILSLSFGDCEANEGTNNTALWEPLWEQAAAQGITVTVATGDSGSANCEDANAPAPNPASTGLQVNAFASTPFNVAVGGTDFNDAGTQTTYFSSTNDPTTLLSAKGYIPESTWNESCTNAAFGTGPEANCNSTAAANEAAVFPVGGGGGTSHCFVFTGTACSGGYSKPAYQSFISAANGMPADGARDLPDVSLFASSGFNKSFYAVCQADAVPAPSCQGQSFSFIGVGGTSASTPSFAGMMALVNQKNGRQGNANFVLYKLAQMQYAAPTTATPACNSVATPLPNASCTFNDVTTGTITVPCTPGSLNCTTSVGTDKYGVLSGYTTTAGYDLATGLGSVNANNLVNNWASGVSAFTPSTVTLALNPTTGITAGQTVNVTVTVTPSTATGDVALVSNAMTGNGVDGFTLGTGGTVTGTTDQLTGGTYQVTARYGGDGTFAPSVSTPVTVTVAKASSQTVASVLTSIGGGNYSPFTTGPAPQTLFLAANINPTGDLLPTGTVNFVDTFNGTSTTVASNVGINQAFEAFTASGITSFGVGSHSIVAMYSGDPSFTASNSAPVVFTITGTNPTPTIVPPLVPASATAGGAAFTLTISGTNFVAGATVNFGANAALTPTSITATQIQVTVPASYIAAAGSPGVTVTNPTPGGGASNSVAFTVNPASGGSFTVTYPAQPSTLSSATGTATGSTITVTPTGGFTGQVTVTATTASLPPGVTCPNSPLNINVTGTAAVTGTLNCQVLTTSTTLTAANLRELRMLNAKAIPPGTGRKDAGKGWWALSAGTGFAALFVLFLPGGRKKYRAALGLGLVCILSFTLGCGGGGGVTPPPPPPTATVTKLTVTSAKVISPATFSFSVAVTGGTPTGMVQLFDGSTMIGTAAAVSGGTAAPTAPALTVGTHSISAHYLGDATTAASASGTLNLTVTGSTTIAITTSPAATPAASPINVMIQ